MKILLLNSNVDNFIITSIVGAILLIFILKLAKDKLRFRKPLLSSFFEDEIEEGQLDDYILNFDNKVIAEKQLSLKSKVLVFFLVAIIVLMPMYQFLEPFRSPWYVDTFLNFLFMN